MSHSIEDDGVKVEEMNARIEDNELEDALQMRYSTNKITINMETNLARASSSSACSSTLVPQETIGKDFAIQTKSDFLRVSIESGSQAGNAKLHHCGTPPKTSLTRNPRQSRGQASLERFSDNDAYRDIEELSEEISLHANNIPMQVKIPSPGDIAPSRRAETAENRYNDDGYFTPATTKHGTIRHDNSNQSAIMGEQTRGYPGYLPQCCHPRQSDAIKSMHDQSSVHSLSDILDEYSSPERKTSSSSPKSHSDKDIDPRSLFRHKLALTSVGLYSTLLQCMGTPVWLNAGLALGAAALITLDGIKREKKTKRRPNVLNTVRGPWSEEEECDEERKRRVRGPIKREKGAVVAALVGKFQNMWK